MDFPHDIAYKLEEYYLLLITGNYTQNIPFMITHTLIWTLALTFPYYFFSETMNQKVRKIEWSIKYLGKFLLKNGYKFLIVVLSYDKNQIIMKNF